MRLSFHTQDKDTAITKATERFIYCCSKSLNHEKIFSISATELRDDNSKSIICNYQYVLKVQSRHSPSIICLRYFKISGTSLQQIQKHYDAAASLLLPVKKRTSIQCDLMNTIMWLLIRNSRKERKGNLKVHKQQ